MKRMWLFILVLVLAALTACNGNDDETTDDDNLDELKALEVEFDVPETADVNETIELKATVTFGDDLVEDADEVDFEYWEEGNKDDSKTIESNNNGDGTYTAEVTFEHDAVITMYAHTTARDLHTMPKKSVTIGEGGTLEVDQDAGDSHEEHVEGFGMHFMDPEDVVVNDEIEVMVHLQMDNDPFEKAEVRYEVWNYDISEKHDWIDVEESVPGEYTATHTFKEPGTYNIQIHVEDDDDLHEHEEYEIEVNN